MLDVSKELQQKIKTLPRSSGVYFHKNAKGEIIYVGKAAVLKNRVRQYFQSKNDMDVKTKALVAEIADTDWIETETELDALFLESEMVKRYMPKFNILLRDDKSATYVRINMKDEVPYVSLVKNPQSEDGQDSATYFGPYYSAWPVKKALRMLRRIFPYYDKPFDPRRRADLNAHIGLSPGIEAGKMTRAEYKASLRQLIRYIKGERVAILRELGSEMKAAADRKDFEDAARLRNQIWNLKALQTQIIFGDNEFMDLSKDQALVELRDMLRLPEIPRRIEGYDISHQSGANVVSGMVVFKNGVSDRAEYRKFKIRRGSNDDLANMRETISRRLGHLADWGRPDLVIIDGGIGQLNAVADLLTEVDIPFIGRSLVIMAAMRISKFWRRRVPEVMLGKGVVCPRQRFWISKKTAMLAS